MTRPRHGYSAAFTPDTLQDIEPIRHIDDITPDWAWAGSTGRGVRVAVIDSGIDASHPAVGAVNGYVEITEASDGPIYNTDPHGDSYGHGTACAGIIRSYAPECELYSVKVLGPALIGGGAVFIAGLRWAVEHGMHVCNLSLGTTNPEYYGMLHELADEAYFRNVMLVTAANNRPIASFPSVYASVISVAGHDVDEPYRFYYNPRPPVEFGAPGIDVRVPWLSGQWITGTGNSYAAPHITGIVAKILGKHPNLTLFHIKAILRALSANVSGKDRPS
jgi:subtilisin